MSNPTPILNNINAFDATKGTTISFNIIGGTDIVRSNIVYIYDLSTNDLICTHLYISTESIHELPPNTDPSIVYADGKSSADFVNNKNYYLQIQTFTNTAGTTGGSGMSVAKTFWCLFDPALSVNAIPAAISTTSYNVGATYTTNITDVTIPATNIIQQYKFDLYTATGTLVQTSGNIIGSGEQEGTSTTYNITYNFSGLVVNNSYYVVVTTTSTEGMTVSAQSNTFTVSIDTPTVGGAIVNNNACDGYISVVSNLSDEYGGHVSGEMASFETDSVNNVSSLKVNMEPIQDLHGYDHPWVGGAGKNILNKDKTFTFTTVEGIYFNQPIPTGTRLYVYLTSHTYETEPSEGSKKIAIRFTTAGGADAGAVTLTDGGTASVVLTAEATQGTIYANGYNYAASQGVTTTINELAISKENITAYSPYSNICPISGWDNVSASVVGKNIFGGRAFADGIKTAIPQAVLNTDAKTISYASGYATLTSNFTSGVRFKKNTQYTIILKFSNTVDRTNMLVAYTDGTSTIIRTSRTGLQTIIFTSATNKTINYIGGSNNNGTSVFYYEECGVFEGVLTADQFEPYDGTTYHQDIEATYTPTVQDNTPYLFKQTGGVGGDRETIELVGGTVAWNQLVSYIDSTHWEPSNIYTSGAQYSDGIGSFVGTGQYAGITLSSAYRPPSLKDHKYLFSVKAKAESTADLQARSFGGYGDINFTASTSWTTASRIFNLPEGDLSSGNRAIILRDKRTSGWDRVYYTDVQLIDLTALFNPTIADYIYSLEQSQAGAGVAWFRRYFPNDYYPYDAGTLRSVEGVSAHETVGFNQWDEEWEVGTLNWTTGENAVSSTRIRSKNYIPCVPNTEYYGKIIPNVGLNIFYYDANKNFLRYRESSVSNVIFVTDSDAYYIRFAVSNDNYGKTYNNDICINLSDPTRNGEYEPYQKHTYPLDSSLTLRGIPKLVDGKLAFDGDVYKADGSVTRKYGAYTFTGNELWRKGSTPNRFSLDFAELISPNAVKAQNETVGALQNLISSKYGRFRYENADKVIYGYGNGGNFTVVINDSSLSTTADVALAFKDTTIVYELATPTTETADGYEHYQICDPSGTEEFVTTGIVPVGHNTTYLTRDIFSGTLDLVTGVLTVDRVMVTFDGSSDEVWTWEATNHQVYTAMHSMKRVPNYQGYMFSDVFETIPNSDVGTVSYPTGVTGYKTTSSYEGQNWIYLRNTEWESRASFISWITENPVQVCYPLAIPQTYQLTPHQIQTLVGQNNVWSDAGNVDVTFNLPISNLLVKRQDASDVSGNWLTLYSQPITQASDMDFTYIDFLNQHGKTYRYALVPLLTQQQGGIDVEIEGGYTVSDDVLSVFDGVFVANSNGSQKLKAATEYGDLETNQDVGVLTTIGGKYPFVVSNSNLNYHSGSIFALIVPSDFYTSGDLDRLSIVERREAIEQFLTDKTAKVLKDWNGNIWLITFVENVEVSFVDDYGMGLGTLSAKWVEIGDVNDQTDLQQTGLI